MVSSMLSRSSTTEVALKDVKVTGSVDMNWYILAGLTNNTSTELISYYIPNEIGP